SARAARIAPASKQRARAEPGPAAPPSAIAIRRDPSDKIAEILGFAEVAVDRGKADIGDLIETRQRIHGETPDHPARDIGLARTLQLAYQRVDNALDPLGLERTFTQGDVDRSGELVAVEGLALAVLLDHRQLAQLHALEGREAGPAIRAEASAANRTAV